MATEYERIDNLMKAIAGLISPHIDCNADASVLDEYDLGDMESRIDDLEQSDYLQSDEIYEHIKGNVKNLISSEIEDLDVLTGDSATDEIDDRVNQKFNDDFNENIRDFFDYEGGGDIISEHIDSNISTMIREEVERQLTPERLVSMFIEGLSEAINGNKQGRYTVTVK